MYQGIEQQHDQSLDPNVREAAGQKGFFLADTLSRVDPKIMAQERMLGSKLDSAEDIANMRSAAQIKAASLKPMFDKEPKTAQETMQRILAKKRRGEPLTELDIETYNIANESFNASLAAKVQPGLELDRSNPQIGKMFTEKPEQIKSPPLSTGNVSTPTNTLQKQVEASGVAYEPTKYDYRVVDGKVQRKAKGN